jgi:hypothetical protein|tara:strand:- start:1229 stop:1492 length:264 start_codon:yes stop_codon:yes gene_type:complete
MKNICINGLSVNISETKERYDLHFVFEIKDKETIHKKIEHTVRYLAAEGFLDNQHKKEEDLRVQGVAVKSEDSFEDIYGESDNYEEE